MSDNSPKYDKKIHPLAYFMIICSGLGMLLFKVPSMMSHTHDIVVATVNGQEVKEQDLTQSVSNLRAQDPDGDIIELRHHALDALIGSILTQQHALNNGYRFSDKGLYDLIKSQYPDAKNYQMMLDNNRMTAKAYQASLRQSQTIDNYYKIISLATQVRNPIADKALYQQFNQARDMTVISLPLTSFTTEIQPTAEDINHYYQTHQDNYLSAETVDLRYIIVEAKNFINPDSITTDEINAERAKHLDSLTRDGHYLIFDHSEDANTAAQAIQTGEKTFADISAAIAAGDIAGQSGELTPTIKGKGVSEEVDNALFALEKIGDVSAVFQTEYGDMMVELGNISGDNNINEDELRQAIISAKSAEKYTELANRLYDDAQNGAELSQLATNSGTEIQQLVDLTASSNKPEWLQLPNLQSQLFGKQAVAVNTTVKPIELTDNRSLFFVITHRAEPMPLPLSAVEVQVTQDYRNEQAKLIQQATANTILETWKTGGNIDELISNTGAEKSQYTDLSQLSDNSTIDPIIKQALLEQTERVTIKNSHNNELMISRIDRIHPAKQNTEIDENTRLILAQQQIFNENSALREGLDQWLRTQSSIQVNNEILNREDN